jgi:predicted protein tyrosine phosphatase
MSTLSEPFQVQSLDPHAKLKYELFHPEIIALNQEVAHHPALCQILANQPQTDVYIRLLEIATYADVILAAEIYELKDILFICEQLTKALYEKRTQLIIPLKS